MNKQSFQPLRENQSDAQGLSNLMSLSVPDVASHSYRVQTSGKLTFAGCHSVSRTSQVWSPVLLLAIKSLRSLAAKDLSVSSEVAVDSFTMQQELFSVIWKLVRASYKQDQSLEILLNGHNFVLKEK